MNEYFSNDKGVCDGASRIVINPFDIGAKKVLTCLSNIAILRVTHPYRHMFAQDDLASNYDKM